jgi:circadian clock protein KaiB
MKLPSKRPAVRVAAKRRPARQPDGYVLRLFVAGATARSRQAILHVEELCGAELKGRCNLEVIDIYQQPELARTNQIVATPTLLIVLPAPMRRFIGSLANVARLIIELDAPAQLKPAR